MKRLLALFRRRPDDKAELKARLIAVAMDKTMNSGALS